MLPDSRIKQLCAKEVTKMKREAMAETSKKNLFYVYKKTRKVIGCSGRELLL